MEYKERTITAKKSYLLYFKEFFEASELLWILAKRDVIVKYKQTILGVAWSALRPLITTIVMAFAFGKIGKLSQETAIPFTLVVLPGVIAWLFFSQSLVSLSNSLVNNANLLTKVYFPRIIIPISTLLLGFIDMLVAICIFFGLCIFYQFTPDFKILLLPFIILLTFFAVFGIGLISAVLNVKFRDIGQLVPFVVQFGYFISPVGYTTQTFQNLSGGDWKYYLFCLNPVTGINDLMRWCMLGDFSPFNMASFVPLIVFSFLSFLFAILFFRKHENSFVDYI
jgi:lipopolysaccharide transport system permease protein